MTDDATARFALPLLAAGQAQKELLHNEALTAIDALVAPCAETALVNDPPAAPLPGQCWIVGNAPTAAWAGNPGALATWTDGGWRMIAPADGLSVWRRDHSCWIIHREGAWNEGSYPVPALEIGGKIVVGPQAAAIASPTGGATIDAEARAAIAAVLAALRGHGLIAA